MLIKLTLVVAICTFGLNFLEFVGFFHSFYHNIIDVQLFHRDTSVSQTN